MHDERPVLLIEDEHNDVLVFRQILEMSACTCPLIHTHDKEKALMYLQDRSIKPQLIVMNLESPELSGAEFLATLKQDATLCSIPVVGLARERHSEVVRQCFAFGIAGLQSVDHAEDFVNRRDAAKHLLRPIVDQRGHPARAPRVVAQRLCGLPSEGHFPELGIQGHQLENPQAAAVWHVEELRRIQRGHTDDFDRFDFPAGFFGQLEGRCQGLIDVPLVEQVIGISVV